MSDINFIKEPHELSHIKKVIGVLSGKGGVGKSLITALLAVAMNQKGFRSAIMDADLTGPSIPRAFGITEKAINNEVGIFPIKSKNGIEIMSINLLLENDTDPVVWRGPLLANTVRQFWTDVIWHDVDVLFVDMPPGTGDIPLTVFQSIPLDGIIVMTSPQDLVSMIVSKAVKMANMMKIPILGLIENMAYFKCPECGKEVKIFGESHIESITKTYNLEILARIPIEPQLSELFDKGKIESYEGKWFQQLIDKLEKNLKEK